MHFVSIIYTFHECYLCTFYALSPCRYLYCSVYNFQYAPFLAISSSCVPSSRILPLSIYIIFDAFFMVDNLWAIINEVLPCKSLSKPFCNAISVFVSILDVASSSISILGLAKRVLANDISCLCPAESVAPLSLTSA